MGAKSFIHYIAAIFCFGFGLLSLILVSGGSDGTWILYSREILHGSRIYTDLSIAQQPLFYLFSILVLKFSKNFFIFEKLLYFPILFLFVYSIFKLSSFIERNNYLRAVLILSMFYVGITFEAFRFDDYHALTSSFILISIYYSIIFFDKKLSFNKFILYQGILFSFTFLTRINEGLALLVTVLMIAFYQKGFSKLFFLGVFKIILIFLFFNILFLYILNENFFTWLNATIISASGAKGGADLYYYPLKIFIYSFIKIKSISFLKLVAIFFIDLIIYYLYRRFARVLCQRRLVNFFWIFFTSLQIVALRILYGDMFAVDLIPFAVISSYIAFSIILAFYLLGSPGFLDGVNPSILLTIYPFSLFFFGSLSSGGSYGSFFFPLSTFIPISAYILLRMRNNYSPLFRQCIRAIFYTSLIFLSAQCFEARAKNPYSWHSYRAPSFIGGFKGYTRLSDTSRGFFFLPTDLYNLVQPVCLTVPPGETLLSLPFSFANYFCNVAPWHGYVQTFFDTTTPSKINRLSDDLNSNPPNYIFYQRQLESMAAHESIFYGGRTLPHRLLDKTIMDNIKNGKWMVVYESDLYPPSNWMLIRTH